MSRRALIIGINGNVTPSSIYTYVDEAMGAWDQRPMFKTNVSRLIYLTSF